MNKSLQDSIEKGIQEADEITSNINHLHTNLGNSNVVNTCFVKAVSNLLHDKNENQYIFEPVEGSSSLFHN